MNSDSLSFSALVFPELKTTHQLDCTPNFQTWRDNNVAYVLPTQNSEPPPHPRHPTRRRRSPSEMAARRLRGTPHHPRRAAQARPDVLQPPRDHQVPHGRALGLLHPTLHGQADGQADVICIYA
ncbi:hypothetical protein L3X38_030739 [Prunus dulcis]|uniref:Uncharacterized protein n=1 Tax=Prunus dulcis TaxID=3755 RepID=A0AAD4YUZ5_PRUDU|nr:hypothetical protein L3X38_030739 [Prunus dulcis]